MAGKAATHVHAQRENQAKQRAPRRCIRRCVQVVASDDGRTRALRGIGTVKSASTLQLAHRVEVAIYGEFFETRAANNESRCYC
jgi:hypothetical protein